MNTRVTVKVPVNAECCLQTAYDTLLSSGYVSNKKRPYMDTLLLFASACVDKYICLINVDKIGEDESEMTVTCSCRLTIRENTTGDEYKYISDFIEKFSLALQNKTS